MKIIKCGFTEKGNFVAQAMGCKFCAVIDSWGEVTSIVHDPSFPPKVLTKSINLTRFSFSEYRSELGDAVSDSGAAALLGALLSWAVGRANDEASRKDGAQKSRDRHYQNLARLEGKVKVVTGLTPSAFERKYQATLRKQQREKVAQERKQIALEKKEKQARRKRIDRSLKAIANARTVAAIIKKHEEFEKEHAGERLPPGDLDLFYGTPDVGFFSSASACTSVRARQLDVKTSMMGEDSKVEFSLSKHGFYHTDGEYTGSGKYSKAIKPAQNHSFVQAWAAKRGDRWIACVAGQKYKLTFDLDPESEETPSLSLDEIKENLGYLKANATRWLVDHYPMLKESDLITSDEWKIIFGPHKNMFDREDLLSLYVTGVIDLRGVNPSGSKVLQIAKRFKINCQEAEIFLGLTS